MGITATRPATDAAAPTHQFGKASRPFERPAADAGRVGGARRLSQALLAKTTEVVAANLRPQGERHRRG